MKTVSRLCAGKGFSVEDVRITADRESWLPRETSPTHNLVFIRTGSFQLRVRDWEAAADPLLAYVCRPGDEQQIAHRTGVVDACTSVRLSSDTYHRLSGPRPVPVGPISTSGRLDLAHRELYLRARARAEEFEISERVHRLAHEVFTAPTRGGRRAEVRGEGRGTVRRHQQLAQLARELLAQDPVSLGLEELARQVDASPHHVSRVFSREFGMSLTRFRNVMRVRQALDRIEEGAENLAELAADLGFSDHAHMTRMVREQVGDSPSGLRKRFAGTDQLVSNNSR